MMDHRLGDDLPKSNPWTEDRLGLSHFAELLSRVIAEISASNGYVIGIQGKWGSGKSTVLNFVTAYLNKHNKMTLPSQGKIGIVNFRPWIVSGHQDIVGAFFKVLSEELSPRNEQGWWKRNGRKIGIFSRNASSEVIDAMAKIGATIDHTGGAASKASGALVKATISKLTERFLSEPSLQATYEELKIKLRECNRKVVVLIDDIDRLNDDEVRLIMQMVKTVGQLPNVIYVLAYDRTKVWKALDGEESPSGPRYAEKIVQQEIDLPRPSKNDLLSLLDAELQPMLGSSGESVRWAYIVRDGVMRWISSPRDVVRLTNAMKFSWLALRGEIDPQDLLAMEGLRLFDESAFNWTRDSRDFLFNEGLYQLSDDETKSAAATALRSKLNEDSRRQILHLLTILFPQAGKWLEEHHFQDESFDEVMVRRGVGSEAGYDAYFGLRPSPDEIPMSIVDAFATSVDDTMALEALIRSYLGRKSSRGEWMVGKLFDELRFRFKRTNGLAPTQAALDALFAAGDQVIGLDHLGGMFSLSPRNQISFLVGSMLDRWGVYESGQRLKEAFAKSSTPGFCSEIYVDRGRELGIFSGGGRERARISQEDFDVLGERLHSMIESAAKDGTLKDAPYYFDIIRSWAHVSKDSALVKEWLSQGLTASGEFMAKAGIGLVSYSLSGSKGRMFRLREEPNPEFFDIAQLVDAGRKHLEQARLTDDQRALIAEIVRGCEQIAAGNGLSEEN